MNIELEPKPTESRKGVAPFTRGINTEGNRLFEYITNQPVPLGDLGEVTMVLTKPNRETLEKISKKHLAFTVGADGEFIRGNLISFLTRGYYMVGVEMKLYDPQRDIIPEKMILIAQINNTQHTVAADLKVGYWHNIASAFFQRTLEDGALETFVLPSDPKILSAIRLDVSDKQKSRLAQLPRWSAQSDFISSLN